MHHTYGFEEKSIAKERQCPICGKAFIARSVRRKYCYCEECQDVRYQKKVAKQKLRRQKRKGTK
jgi:endogenous inhibitor of DNA gyrase (YacG/DUF329 family)